LLRWINGWDLHGMKLQDTGVVARGRSSDLRGEVALLGANFSASEHQIGEQVSSSDIEWGMKTL
jgi:hypothetical protein